MPARHLQNMTWEEFRDEVKRGTVVILPVGSTEQHAGHLPVGTDTIVAIALAKDYVPQPTELYSVDPRYPGDTLCYIPSTTAGMAKSVEAAGGTTGSPTRASREKGKAYHEHLVDRLVEVVERMK